MDLLRESAIVGPLLLGGNHDQIAECWKLILLFFGFVRCVARLCVRCFNVTILAVNRRFARNGGENFAADRGTPWNEDPVVSVEGRAITDAECALRHFLVALADCNA